MFPKWLTYQAVMGSAIMARRLLRKTENPREAEAMLELGGTVLGLIVAMVLIVRLFSSVFQLLD